MFISKIAGQQWRDWEWGTEWLLEGLAGTCEECEYCKDEVDLSRHLIKHIGTFQDYDTSDLADFAETIMKGCDTNKDGKVSKKVIGFLKKIKFLISIFSGADSNTDDFVQPVKLDHRKFLTLTSFINFATIAQF